MFFLNEELCHFILEKNLIFLFEYSGIVILLDYISITNESQKFDINMNICKMRIRNILFSKKNKSAFIDFFVIQGTYKKG